MPFRSISTWRGSVDNYKDLDMLVDKNPLNIFMAMEDAFHEWIHKPSAAAQHVLTESIYSNVEDMLCMYLDS